MIVEVADSDALSGLDERVHRRASGAAQSVGWVAEDPLAPGADRASGSGQPNDANLVGTGEGRIQGDRGGGRSSAEYASRTRLPMGGRTIPRRPKLPIRLDPEAGMTAADFQPNVGAAGEFYGRT